MMGGRRLEVNSPSPRREGQFLTIEEMLSGVMNPRDRVFRRRCFSEIVQHPAILPAPTINYGQAEETGWARERIVVYAERAGKISLDVDGRRWDGVCATDPDAVQSDNVTTCSANFYLCRSRLIDLIPGGHRLIRQAAWVTGPAYR